MGAGSAVLVKTSCNATDSKTVSLLSTFAGRGITEAISYGVSGGTPAGPRGYSESEALLLGRGLCDDPTGVVRGAGRLAGIPGAGDWGCGYLPSARVSWLCDLEAN